MVIPGIALGALGGAFAIAPLGAIGIAATTVAPGLYATANVSPGMKEKQSLSLELSHR